MVEDVIVDLRSTLGFLPLQLPGVTTMSSLVTTPVGAANAENVPLPGAATRVCCGSRGGGLILGQDN